MPAFRDSHADAPPEGQRRLLARKDPNVAQLLRRIPRIFVIALAVASLGLGVVACGDDGDTAGGGAADDKSGGIGDKATTAPRPAEGKTGDLCGFYKRCTGMPGTTGCSKNMADCLNAVDDETFSAECIAKMEATVAAKPEKAADYCHDLCAVCP